MLKNIISKKIVIPIEIKVREFLPKVYLAYKIVANSDFDVIVGAQRNYTNQLIYKNCLLLDKNTKFIDRQNFPFHKENFIAMLDEEGPISFQHKTIIKERYSLNYLRSQIDSFLFYGNKDLDKINYNKIKNNSFVVGHPKFDFLDTNLELIFKKENTFIRNKFKNFVFITGHFPSSSTRVTDKWIMNASKNFLNNEKNLEKHMKSKLKFNNLRRKNYESLLILTMKIAKENPDITFIFRRHPMENDEFLSKVFADKPKNLKLIYKFSVTPWIYNCNIHLHSGCMSSLETIKLKKKLITYLPFYSKEFFENYKNFNPFFSKESHCLKFFKNKEKMQNKFYYKKMQNILFNLSKGNSCKEILKLFKRKYNRIQSQVTYKKKDRSNFLILKNLFFKIGSHFKSALNEITFIKLLFSKFLPHLTDTREVKNMKLKSISQKEMNETIKLFLKADKKKTKIIIKKLSQSTFYISKNKKHF